MRSLEDMKEFLPFLCIIVSLGVASCSDHGDAAATVRSQESLKVIKLIWMEEIEVQEVPTSKFDATFLAPYLRDLPSPCVKDGWGNYFLCKFDKEKGVMKIWSRGPNLIDNDGKMDDVAIVFDWRPIEVQH